MQKHLLVGVFPAANVRSVWGCLERELWLLTDPTPLLCSQAFSQFARTEAIQRMEIFEYCQQLRQPESFLLPLQVVDMLNYILQ